MKSVPVQSNRDEDAALALRPAPGGPNVRERMGHKRRPREQPMNSENSPKGEAFHAARFRPAPANVASRRTWRSNRARVTLKVWSASCPVCVAHNSRFTSCESRHFYSTMPPSRNRRNPHKTNNRCTLYSTINRGGPEHEFALARKLLVTNHRSQITKKKQDTVSSHFPRNSNKTNDRRPNQPGHFFDLPLVAQTILSVLLRATGNNAQPQSRANNGGANRGWYAFPAFTNRAKRSDTTCKVPSALSPTKQRLGALAK